MRLIAALFILTGLASCVSEQDKLAKKLEAFDHLIEKNTAPDSIPDSVARMMHDYAVAYPKDAKSEKYLYISTLVVEAQGAFFETAKWCEEYVKLYPDTKNTEKAMIAAAVNYEKSGTVDKAIEYYLAAAKKYPASPVAQQGLIKADLLKKGLFTAEEQLNYILSHKDSSQNP